MAQPAIETAISLQGVSKRFAKVLALDDVDLEVAAGTIFGLLGPNGAGKTTAVRVLTTIIPPDAGSARVLGWDVVSKADEVRAHIGLAGQYAAVDENLTGSENLRLIGRLTHLERGQGRRRAGELLERFELSEAADRPARTYSGGMRRRLDWRLLSSINRRSSSWTSPPPVSTLAAERNCGSSSGSWWTRVRR